MRKEQRPAAWMLALWLVWAVVAYGAERFVSVSELAQGAEVVVRAEIGASASRMVEIGGVKFPFIFFEAKVKEVMAGTITPSFSVRVPGFIAGDTIIAPADAPALGKGSDVVLFLRKAPGAPAGDNVFELISLASGALPVMAVAGKAVVAAPVRAASSEDRGRVLVKLADLSTQVKAARMNQRSEAKKP